MKQRIKEGPCPKCGKMLYRRHVKPTQCNYCGFKIENFKEVFKPRYKIK